MKILDDLVQAFSGLEYSYVEAVNASSVNIDPLRKRKEHLLSQLNIIATELQTFADMNGSVSSEGASLGAYLGLLDKDQHLAVIERYKNNITSIIESLMQDYYSLACTSVVSQEVVIEYRYYFFRRARIIPLFSRFYCWGIYYSLQQISFFIYYCFEKFPESEYTIRHFVEEVKNLEL